MENELHSSASTIRSLREFSRSFQFLENASCACQSNWAGQVQCYGGRPTGSSLGPCKKDELQSIAVPIFQSRRPTLTSTRLTFALPVIARSSLLGHGVLAFWSVKAQMY